jgi:branched-chain amino acid transport system permease protein
MENLSASYFLQVIVNGFYFGSWLMLASLGLTLLFGVAHIFNLAHGEFYMLGGYGTWFFFALHKINYWIAILLSMFIVAVMGIGVERYIFRRFRGNLLPTIAVCSGLILIFDNTVTAVFGTVYKSIPSVFQGSLLFWGARISIEKTAIILASLLLTSLAILFIFYTKPGSAIRAVAEDQEGAALQGISVNKVCALTMVIGSSLAAGAGGLVGPVYSISAEMGLPILLKGSIAIALGGMGSIGGVLIASYIIGMVESFSATFLGAEISSMILFLTLMVILMVKPTGLRGYTSQH